MKIGMICGFLTAGTVLLSSLIDDKFGSLATCAAFSFVWGTVMAALITHDALKDQLKRGIHE